MQTFLNTVVQDLQTKSDSFSNYTIILPSKRAGVFLKDEFKKCLHKTVILPRIISIEDFIEELSNLNSIDNTSLVFEFYKIYLEITPKDQVETFDAFCNWATIVLNDFNEIDRHLVDAKNLFDYLKDIKRLEVLLEETDKKTSLIKKQFSFFEKLHSYYTNLTELLLSKKIAYQGLQYREAVENLQLLIANTTDHHYVFVGFNALNKAEERIFTELLDNNLASVYWDVDSYFYSIEDNSTSFIRKYITDWNYYKNDPYQNFSSEFSKNKNIQLIGTPKKISQIKYASELLDTFTENNYNSTAIVLADESLLTATLNSLPDMVQSVNITMGYELKNIPLYTVFQQLFRLHLYKKNQKFYYKNVINFLRLPQVRSLFENERNFEKLITNITKNNYSYITYNQLIKLTDDKGFSKISSLFDNWNDNASTGLAACLDFIEILKENTSETLPKEHLFRFFRAFNQLKTLNDTFNYIKDIKTLYSFYQQIIRNEKLSFKGEPLSGLQVMGMLETRVLDFKNLIITSVNEGILPSGRTENSFIPYDIKVEKGLPTFKEKDAIFSYHFFRLIQRAENIYILYNTENDSYGSGEQSRFITQLELYKENDIQKSIVSSAVKPVLESNKSITKSNSLQENLKDLALKGFSPTTLTSYILNPIEFYKQRILKIKEVEEVEETVASNTLGNIIHKTLHHLYLPHKEKVLTEDSIKELMQKAPKEVDKWFSEEYTNGNIETGKNILIYNVAQQFVKNFLQSELDAVKEGKIIKIIALEHDMETTIHVDSLDFPIKLTGQADRIDEANGVLRIIDYKTGKVEQNQLNIKDWALLTTDYEKYSKSFQVLFYAFLYTKINAINLNESKLESGIISFKNLKSGFLKVNKAFVEENDLALFTEQLKALIKEIFDMNIPIIDNKVSYN